MSHFTYHIKDWLSKNNRKLRGSRFLLSIMSRAATFLEKTRSFWFYSFAPQNLRLNEGANVEATTGNGKERVQRWERVVLKTVDAWKPLFWVWRLIKKVISAHCNSFILEIWLCWPTIGWRVGEGGRGVILSLRGRQNSGGVWKPPH